MVSKFLVCTVVDLGSGEMCPPFIVHNMTVAWREFENLMSKSPVPRSEFVLGVVGRWEPGCVSPLALETAEYWNSDRQIIPSDQVARALNQQEDGE